jgi:chorismate mutase
VRHKGDLRLDAAPAQMKSDRPETDSLLRIRQELESIDRTIVLALAARLDAAHRAIRMRAARGHPITDREQERRVLLRSRRWAEEFGVSKALVESLFRSLVEEGKARYLSVESRLDSPVVTVLLASPGGSEMAARNHAHAQLVAVPKSR